MTTQEKPFKVRIRAAPDPLPLEGFDVRALTVLRPDGVGVWPARAEIDEDGTATIYVYMEDSS